MYSNVSAWAGTCDGRSLSDNPYFGDSPGRHALVLDTRGVIDLDMLERLLWSAIPISGGFANFENLANNRRSRKGFPQLRQRALLTIVKGALASLISNTLKFF